MKKYLLCILPFLASSLFADVKLLPGFQYEPILKKIEEPLDLKIAPNGEVWATGRCGDIWIYSPKTNQEYLMKKLKGVDCSHERGLHGIEFDPKYSENGNIYLYYAIQVEDEYFNLVTKWVVKNDGGKLTLDEKSRKELLRIPSEEDGFHEGGALEYNPKDGKLYVTVGDGLQSPKTDKFYTDPKKAPQNLKDLRGKVLRLNLDGSIPKDNPFVDKEDHKPEIFSYGHRNPYTLTIDKKTGKAYAGEVGYDHAEFSREEVNLLQPGGNYGWPRCQGTNLGTFGGPCPLKDAINPYMEYPRQDTASLTMGDFFYKTDSKAYQHFPYDYGFFYADMVRSWIRFAEIDKNGKVGATSLFAGGIRGILAVRIAPEDGAVYVTEYSGWLGKGKNDRVGKITFDKKWKAADSRQGKTGSFKASAWWEKGATFTNSLECDLKVAFKASGEWTYAPHDVKQTAQGLKAAPPDFLLPGAPIGGLIAKRGNNEKVFMGVEKELVLKKGETVSFLINDAINIIGGRTYEDNEGSLEITWKHEGCK